MKITDIKSVAITSFAIASLLMGCSEEVYDGAYKPSLESHYLSVYPRDFEFGNGEETKTGLITSENAWSFTSVPSWLSLTPSNGNSDAAFSVTSAINETISSKTAVFYLSANTSEWNQQRTITASQSAASPCFQFVNLENTSIYLNGESHTLTIDVETNIDDLVTEIYDAESWLSASYQDKRLTIAVNVNDDGYQRSGRVQLWSSTYSKGGTIYITQYKPNLSFNEITSLSFNAEGGSQNVNITSEIPWFALSKESWIEITPSEGQAGGNQVKITALPSYQSGNRNGKVLFYYKDNQSAVGSISVSQSGRYLKASPSSITLAAEANSSSDINIDSNIGWNIESHPDWVSFSKKNGEAGKSTTTITAEKNNSLNSRSGTIILKDSKSGGIEARVSITQNGLDFGDQTTIEFGWQTSTQSISIPIPNKWTATISDGWISMSQYTGFGATECDVTVSRNDDSEPRTGQIVFTSEDKNIPINIVQNGQYINIESTSGEASALGATIELFFNSSINISPTIEYTSDITDWIGFEKVSDNTYSLTVKYNPSINPRSASFILMPKDGDVKDEFKNGVRFNIKQFGRDLAVEPSRIILFAKGGTTEMYSIKADGSYSIVKPESLQWFTLVHDSSNNTYYIVAEENKTETLREGHISVSLLDLPYGEEKTIVIQVLQNSIYNTEIIYDDYDDDQVL